MMASFHNMARGPSARSVCWALLVAAFAFLIVVQQRINTELGVYAKIADVLYIPSGENLRRVSLGNEGLLADIYWTRAVQYYGLRHMENAGGRYELLAPLLRIATDLDPHLLIAYRFGAIFLMQKPPAGAGQPEEAMQLIRRGIVANPSYWRLWQDWGFIYYWELKDYKSAARIFAVGSRQPGAEYWLKSLAGTIAAKGGELETSRLLWSEIYNHAATDAIRETAQDHLAALTAIEDLKKLNEVLAIFRAKQGHDAQSFFELISAGLLRSVPQDPFGTPYVIGQDGRTRLGPASRVSLWLVQ